MANSLNYQPQVISQAYITAPLARPMLATELSIDYIAAPDPTGGYQPYKRNINILVKSLPKYWFNRNATQSPIVIYSHGGGSGNALGHIEDGQEWTDVLVQAGFITINVGHPYPEDVDQLIATCGMVNVEHSSVSKFTNATIGDDLNNNLDPNQNKLHHYSDCAQFQANMVLRIRDVQTVIDKISTVLSSTVPVIRDHWNGSLVYMGHSSGSASVMTFAGATRTFMDATNSYTYPDTTLFDAYVALSPQSHNESEPHVNGFAEHAWSNIQEPVLMITGVDDSSGQAQHEQLAVKRKIPFDDMPVGGKYRLWFTGSHAGHHQMSLSGHSIYKSPTGDKAEQYDTAIQTVIRFLDMYARNQPALVLDYNFVTTIVPGGYTDLDFDVK